MPMKTRRTYSVEFPFGRSGNNPSANTTYYLGFKPGANFSTTAGDQRVYAIRPGRIVRCLLLMQSTAVTTNESWTWSIRKNNTTNYTILAIATTQAEKVFYNTTMNVPMTWGDYFELVTTTPNPWVTPPVNCQGYWMVTFEEGVS